MLSHRLSRRLSHPTSSARLFTPLSSVIALAAAAGLAAGLVGPVQPAGAQTTPAPQVAEEGPAGPAGLFTETVSVDLVNVEVYATDSDGAPVLDLGPADFRVYEDGRPVEVTHFAVVGGARKAGPGAAGAAAPSTQVSAEGTGGAEKVAPEPAKVVLFIDEIHTGPGSRQRLARDLPGALDRLLSPGDEVMVVAYDGTFDVLCPFTTDHEKVRAALAAQKRITANQLQAGFADQRALEDVQLQQLMEAGGNPKPGVTGICVRIGGLAETFADQAYNRVEQTIDALTGFVNSLAGLPGRKVLVHVSDGIPLVPGGQVLNYAIELCDGSGALKGVDYATDVLSMGNGGMYNRWDPFSARQRLNELDTTRDWQALAAHANAHQVTFYPVQAQGLDVQTVTATSDVRMSGSTIAFGSRNLQDTLDLIARETGGRATLNTNDVPVGLERALADSRFHYLLAFKPTATEAGTVHRIRVETDRPGIHLRHRMSYRAKSEREQVSDVLLSALLYGEEQNPLDIIVQPTEAGSADGATRAVRFRVVVPLSKITLLPRGERFEGMFTVYLRAQDEEGDTTPVRYRSIPISVPLEGMLRDFVYEVEMNLDMGRHTVAVAVHDELGGDTAYVKREIPPAATVAGM